MEDTGEEKDFFIERAKTGRAACKKCKEKCENGVLRIAKLIPNFFSDTGKLKQWYHIDCLFEAFKTQKATTKRIESVEDIEGWNTLTETDQDLILEKLGGSLQQIKKTKTSKSPEGKASTSHLSTLKADSDDNLFQTFRDICEQISNVSGHIQKSNILHNFLIKGSNGKKFEGDFCLWYKLLLPMTSRRVYNLASKQLIKLFSRIFRVDHDEMMIDLEQGDVSETIRKYFTMSRHVTPHTNSSITLHKVDQFLDKMTELTKEDDQIECFQELCKICTPDDLKTVIRLIKHDLRMNAGPRNILDALNPVAYSTFQSSRDLEMVVTRFAPLIKQNKIGSADGNKMLKTLGGAGCSNLVKGSGASGGVQLMSPISPMLAEACKSVEKAISKNPEGMYSEIKYDGERVQIHKCGNEFKFFSRNLKPVLDSKISRCKEFIPKAFPTGQDIILDSEIIVVNTKTGGLLPFGTLGRHKREQFESSEVCLFVFDCIYYNGEDLTKKPLIERKKILKDNIKPIKHHVELSEYYLIKTKKELASMMAKVLKASLEGLVLKNIKSFYQPGKRGWLKLKKDYLFEGQMADAADLVVLGAWFGTGKKGGMLSIFLMGCYDTKSKMWKTVTKVHSGLDDSTMEELQDELKALMHRANPDKIPNWIHCRKQLIPDFIANNPVKMPVWEITGAEFTKAEAHTANGISIRFPRITRMRHDKSSKNATSLQELELLFKNSKEHINVDMLFKGIDESNSDEVDIKTRFFDPNKSGDINSDSPEDEEISSSSSVLSSSKRKSLKYEGRSNSSRDDIKLSPIEKKKLKFNTNSETKYKVNQCEDENKSEKSLNIKNEKKDMLIFDDVRLYVESDALKYFEPIRMKFVQNGGSQVENSHLATHALHFHNKVTCSDFLLLRKKYQPQCRHLTCNWIVDCITQDKLLSIGNYAVFL